MQGIYVNPPANTKLHQLHNTISLHDADAEALTFTASTLRDVGAVCCRVPLARCDTCHETMHETLTFAHTSPQSAVGYCIEGVVVVLAEFPPG